MRNTNGTASASNAPAVVLLNWLCWASSAATSAALPPSKMGKRGLPQAIRVVESAVVSLNKESVSHSVRVVACWGWVAVLAKPATIRGKTKWAAWVLCSAVSPRLVKNWLNKGRNVVSSCEKG